MKKAFVKYGMTVFGFMLTAITLAGVNTASWTLIHSEPVPEELK